MLVGVDAQLMTEGCATTPSTPTRSRSSPTSAPRPASIRDA